MARFSHCKMIRSRIILGLRGPTRDTSKRCWKSKKVRSKNRRQMIAKWLKWHFWSLIRLDKIPESQKSKLLLGSTIIISG